MASQPVFTTADIPSQDERTMAFLAHLLQVFTGFIGPLIIYCVKQDSRFVRFHALQSLIWQIAYMTIFFAGMIVFFVTVFMNMAHNGGSGNPHSPAPPPGFFIFFPVLWLFGMGGWIANVVLGIFFGIKANRGEWAPYPIIGKWLLPKFAPAPQTPVAPRAP
jgi:uncharacterized protein